MPPRVQSPASSPSLTALQTGDHILCPYLDIYKIKRMKFQPLVGACRDVCNLCTVVYANNKNGSFASLCVHGRVTDNVTNHCLFEYEYLDPRAMWCILGTHAHSDTHVNPPAGQVPHAMQWRGATQHRHRLKSS